LDRRREREGGRGDHRPDPAPFLADDGTPSLPADDQHSRQWRAQNGRGRVRGERDRGSATAIGPRTTGRGITASPPSDTAGQSVDVAGGWARETAGSGRVSGAVAHLSKRRRAARPRDAIADWMLGMGDHRPAVRCGRMMAVGTFDVCSNAAVNSDLSCHGLRGSASPVLTATGFVNGRWQFSTPHRIHTP